ncbi:MAG TPA: two-component regulator propeller domain-containing protein [Acidobacteriaceae bacterium]|nr:two-component regulator propeller domain-containing protein [Acidobacteriaceae bacterium]
MKRIAVLLVLILALGVNITGAEIRGFRGYTSKLWSAQDGLPDQNIQALAQTADGRLWIGTRSGLLSFDGAGFTNFARSTAPAAIERGVNSLLAARDGSLWIGTEGGGLLCYRNHQFHSYAVAARPPNEFVRAIFEDRAGTVWVGADQGLFRVSGTTLVRVDGAGRVPAIFVRAITEDRSGNIWVGGNELLEFSGGTYQREIPLPGNLSQDLVYSLFATQDGAVWAGALSGLYQLTPQDSLRRFDGFSAPVAVIAQISDGPLWVGTTGQGIAVVRNRELDRIGDAGLPSRAVTALIEDREGNIWIGTRAGVVRLTRTPVDIVRIPGWTDSEFETLYGDSDGSLWMTASSHLFHIQHGIARPWQLPGMSGLRVRTLLRDRQGNLWIGTDGQGLLRIGQERMTRYTISNGLINDFVRVILQSRDGSMWVGTDGGLTHIAPRDTQNFDTRGGLAYFSVTSLLEARDGDLWIGTSRGLSHRAGNGYVHDAATEALGQEQLWSIFQDTSGEIWFGTSSGLYGFGAGKLARVTTAQGLATNTVYDILEDNRGNVWLSGPNCISRLRAGDLDAFAQGRSARVHLTLFVDSHDLESNSLYGGLQPEGAVAPDGDVWFPGSNGAVHIAVRSIAPETRFPVMIDQIVADGQVLPPSGKVVLQPGDGRLEITYGAVRLRSQEAIRYRYRMKGLEPWNDASTRRTAYYTRLPSGKYSFQVEATAIDNPGAVAETSIEIVQQPHFYATLWFAACCVVALLGLIFLVYRLRLRQMQMRFQAVAEERARLAREMHDTVIQGCAGISALLEAALGVEETEEPLREQLMNYANEQARATIESAREAVWALRNPTTTPSDIGSLCAGLARKFESESGIPVVCRLSGPPFSLGDAETHEVEMTVREALANAVAHSGARRIALAVSFGESELIITIQDDGTGFDPDAVIRAGGHYGLIGMRERIGLLGGRISIASHSGRGTEITIAVSRRPSVRERKAAHVSVENSH